MRRPFTKTNEVYFYKQEQYSGHNTGHFTFWKFLTVTNKPNLQQLNHSMDVSQTNTQDRRPKTHWSKSKSKTHWSKTKKLWSKPKTHWSKTKTQWSKTLV